MAKCTMRPQLDMRSYPVNYKLLCELKSLRGSHNEDYGPQSIVEYTKFFNWSKWGHPISHTTFDKSLQGDEICGGAYLDVRSIWVIAELFAISIYTIVYPTPKEDSRKNIARKIWKKGRNRLDSIADKTKLERFLNYSETFALTETPDYEEKVHWGFETTIDQCFTTKRLPKYLSIVGESAAEYERGSHSTPSLQSVSNTKVYAGNQIDKEPETNDFDLPKSSNASQLIKEIFAEFRNLINDCSCSISNNNLELVLETRGLTSSDDLVRLSVKKSSEDDIEANGNTSMGLSLASSPPKYFLSANFSQQLFDSLKKGEASLFTEKFLIRFCLVCNVRPSYIFTADDNISEAMTMIEERIFNKVLDS